MGAELTSKHIGRIGASFLVAGGALSALRLFLPRLPVDDRLVAGVIGGAAVLVGLIAWLLPWESWPRLASMGLLPVAFAFIAVDNYVTHVDRPYTYGIIFVLAFAWLGIGHPRWASLVFGPLAVAAFLVPVLVRGQSSAGAFAVTFVTVGISVVVGECLAWMGAIERHSRETAQSLARISQSLSRHLTLSALGQSIVEEARALMKSEHAVLYQLDTATGTIGDVFTAGLPDHAASAFKRLRGVSYAGVPRIDTLKEGHPIIVEDVAASPQDMDLLPYNVKSYIAMPVMAQGSLVGVLWYSESSNRRSYSHNDISVAGAFAGHASAAFTNARLYEETAKASRFDLMTGLANRRAFREQLEIEVARAERYGRTLTLMLLDADTLKDVNDAWGHNAGDRVIGRLAGALKDQPRPEDVAYRIGGDEFALILPETDAAGAAVVAERLRHRVETDRLGVGSDLRLTVSVGIACLRDHGITPDNLFARADAALRKVKSAGGNAIAFADTADVPSAPGVVFGVDIPKLIREQLVVPYYQPIFAVDSGQAFGYEAFCRLEPAVGSVPTQSLLRAAGALGLLEALDAAFRAVALRGATGLRDDQRVFINVTPAAVADAAFSPDGVIEAAERAGLSREQLVLELTEQERSAVSGPLTKGLSACIEAGIELAIDDFGGAGADLDLLCRVPFRYVKIDSGFVHGAKAHTSRVRLLTALGIVARETGAHIIAEGVETREDLDMICELGFEAVQGYFLKPPATRIDPLEPLSVLSDGRRICEYASASPRLLAARRAS